MSGPETGKRNGQPRRLANQASRAKRRRKTILPWTLVKSNRSVELLPFVDADSVWMKGWLEDIQRLASDRGGWEFCSEAEKMLIQHTATLNQELRLQGTKLAQNGEGGLPKVLHNFQQSFGNLRRALETLGTKRSPRDISEILEPVQEKPSPVQAEIRKRALIDGDNALLATLYRSEQQREQQSGEGPRLVVIYEGPNNDVSV